METVRIHFRAIFVQEECSNIVESIRNEYHARKHVYETSNSLEIFKVTFYIYSTVYNRKKNKQ